MIKVVKGGSKNNSLLYMYIRKFSLFFPQKYVTMKDEKVLKFYDLF